MLVVCSSEYEQKFIPIFCQVQRVKKISFVGCKKKINIERVSQEYGIFLIIAWMWMHFLKGETK